MTRKYLRFEGMTWPNPDDPDEVLHTLVYGSPSRAEVMYAASVIHAYGHLVAMPQRERNERVRQLRTALTTTPAHDPAEVPAEVPGTTDGGEL